MKDRIENLLKEISALTAHIPGEVEQLRLKYLSKKGLVSVLFDEFRNVPAEQKKEVGQLLNRLKSTAQEKIENLKAGFEDKAETADPGIDLSRPVAHMEPGTRHPLSIVRNEIIRIFGQIGYAVAEGPEIEDDWHNFSALNFPPEHPARDMQDTFFISRDPEILLRTHTSSVQIRTMESEKPPIRKIFPGRVFRNEAISARAHCIFHQVEGLYVDRNVSFMDMKQTLLYFSREMFGESLSLIHI